LQDAHPQNQKRAIAIPSLGGEGQVEGGRKQQISFAMVKTISPKQVYPCGTRAT
jgi:hypothetical protein